MLKTVWQALAFRAICAQVNVFPREVGGGDVARPGGSMLTPPKGRTQVTIVTWTGMLHDDVLGTNCGDVCCPHGGPGKMLPSTESSLVQQDGTAAMYKTAAVCGTTAVHGTAALRSTAPQLTPAPRRPEHPFLHRHRQPGGVAEELHPGQLRPADANVQPAVRYRGGATGGVAW